MDNKQQAKLQQITHFKPSSLQIDEVQHNFLDDQFNGMQFSQGNSPLEMIKGKQMLNQTIGKLNNSNGYLDTGGGSSNGNTSFHPHSIVILNLQNLQGRQTETEKKQGLKVAANKFKLAFGIRNYRSKQMSVAVSSTNIMTDKDESLSYFQMQEGDYNNIEEENKRSDESSQSFSEMIKMTREPGISMFEVNSSSKRNPFTSGLRKLKQNVRVGGTKIKTKPQPIIKNNTVVKNKDQMKYNLLSDILRNVIPILTKSQKKSLWILWKRDVQISKDERRMLWMRASGAANQLMHLHNKGYYESLCKLEMNYPNPSFSQIDLDLKRTFSDMPEEEAEQYIPILRRILITYVKRNPTIGYCQGMNFIVGRLLQFMNEEEAFWTLTQILETILPIDYYSNMVGVLIDQQVFKKLVQLLLPDVSDHLERLKFDPSLLAFQWFVCFYTYNMTLEASLKVWDLFMIKGVKVLFNAGLSILSILKKSLLEAQDFQTAFLLIDQTSKSEVTVEKLIEEMKKFAIRKRAITKLRNQQRPEVENDLQKLIEQKDQNDKGPYPKLNFINKFFLYTGLCKYYEQKELGWKTMEQFERDLMQIFNCDQEWPICLFDFTYKNKIPNNLCFKIKETITSCMIHDYFDFEIPKSDLYSDNFIRNFKYLFNENHELIFRNPLFSFKISDEIEALEKIKLFIKEISAYNSSQDEMEFQNEENTEFFQMIDRSPNLQQMNQITQSKAKKVIHRPRSNQLTSFMQDLVIRNHEWLENTNQIQEQDENPDTNENYNYNRTESQQNGLFNSIKDYQQRTINQSQSFVKTRLPSIHQHALERVLKGAGSNHQLVLKSNTSSGVGIFQDYIQSQPQINPFINTLMETESFLQQSKDSNSNKQQSNYQ
ncbi:tbc domain-containing protein [Stylonychia lemnae]|uniref:Tbc domain-containing protein n=1 Tax=Stylonychia lemnae TaxID=5949 RepID=A0A078B443_STYLE|nr:tbc domain-containing protein [Stylonychia lemnae]|eukprot:CDW87967.1 tbc domain-containing protein [Stylonychia lemnae]